MAGQRDDLLVSIAETIKDYRAGEIAPITPAHVNRWVTQFDPVDQLIILDEMNRILGQYYVSKAKAVRILRAALSHPGMFGTNPAAALPHAMFLNRQRKGSSQSELLVLVNQLLKEMYGASLESCGTSPTTYIYLDDCVFTGNTVRWDLADWFSINTARTRLFLVFFAIHNAGWEYARSMLAPLAAQHRIRLESIKSLTLRNDATVSNPYLCLWPERNDYNEYVQTYLTKLGVEPSRSPIRLPFRPDHLANDAGAFSSVAARRIVERAFLNAGAYICAQPREPNVSMRPLGYEHKDSLGFGAVFTTYRNISNNTPLVLWWGDPSFPDWHPLSHWYPLFPRRSNQDTRRAVTAKDAEPEYRWPEDMEASS